MESIGYSITASYFFLSGIPFSIYGENVTLLLQSECMYGAVMGFVSKSTLLSLQSPHAKFQRIYPIALALICRQGLFTQLTCYTQISCFSYSLKYTGVVSKPASS